MTLLKVDLETKNWFDDRQYGFRTRRGTEDAVNCLINEVKEFLLKYVMGVFLDINGTFNAVRWDHMLEEIEKVTEYRYLVALTGTISRVGRLK